MKKYSIPIVKDWLKPREPERWRLQPLTPTNWNKSSEEPNPSDSIDWKPRPAIARVVLCRVSGFEGIEAVCTVYLEGYELQRVGFPAQVLRRHHLDVGSWFNWVVREASEVQSGDILPIESPIRDLTAAEIAQLKAKSEAAVRRVVEGEPWPEYTGDGE
jgi:hypothetical protein